MYSIKKNEQVCTNFNCLYDLVNNLFDVKILNYNIDLTKGKTKLIAFLKLGEDLGISYIETYNAFKRAEKKAQEQRKINEETQRQLLETSNLKILLTGHPYNLYDDLIGKTITDFLTKNNISVLYSDKIDNTIIDTECQQLSTDIHWTHSKEVVASINYYHDKVDGIIIISSFPCGPDSLSNELVTRKIKNIPIITLVFEDLNSESGIITRLESFIDILERRSLCQK